MANELQGRKVAFIATEGVEQVELERPLQAVRDAGGEAVVLNIEEGAVQAFNHLDRGDEIPADGVVSEADADDFDGLVIPGGVANGDFLRADEAAVRFTKRFFEQGKPVASICHGPWILAEAGVVNGRKLTSWPSLQTDLRNAGATWVDEEVVVDGNLITSRKPDDLDAFGAAIVEEFAAARGAGARDDEAADVTA